MVEISDPNLPFVPMAVQFSKLLRCYLDPLQVFVLLGSVCSLSAQELSSQSLWYALRQYDFIGFYP